MAHEEFTFTHMTNYCQTNYYTKNDVYIIYYFVIFIIFINFLVIIHGHHYLMINEALFTFESIYLSQTH